MPEQLICEVKIDQKTDNSSDSFELINNNKKITAIGVLGIRLWKEIGAI